MGSRRYTAEKIEAIRAELSQAKLPSDTDSFSTRDLVWAVRREIRAMRVRGFTLTKIAELLTDQGVQIGDRSLSAYLRDAERKGRTRRGRSVRSAATAKQQPSLDATPPSEPPDPQPPPSAEGAVSEQGKEARASARQGAANREANSPGSDDASRKGQFATLEVPKDL